MEFVFWVYDTVDKKIISRTCLNEKNAINDCIAASFSGHLCEIHYTQFYMPETPEKILAGYLNGVQVK